MAAYKSVIIPRIPADIPSDRHPDIIATIEAVNVKLAANRWTTRDYAIEIAAIALSKSGVGACGQPSAEKV